MQKEVQLDLQKKQGVMRRLFLARHLRQRQKYILFAEFHERCVLVLYLTQKEGSFCLDHGSEKRQSEPEKSLSVLDFSR